MGHVNVSSKIYIFTGVILLLGAILGLHVWLPFGQSLRIVAASLFLFFLPGYVWSYMIWRTSLPWVERVIMSILTSVVGIPLLAYLLNLAGIPLTGLTVFLETVVVICIGFVLLNIVRKTGLYHWLRRPLSKINQ